MAADDLFEPPDWLDREEEVLAPYAMRTRHSRGRRHPEADSSVPHALSSATAIASSTRTAFRRLMYKTQVLVNQTNDHHRTRLTHTLEVAQISRTIARQLGLNEDLTEAIALAHDLGHPPFGHAGESGPRRVHGEHGGFEHNLHGLRIVEVLEYRYADFPGLNLSWEVLRGPGACTANAATSPEVRDVPRRRPAVPRSPGRRCRRQPGLRHARHRRRPQRRPDHHRRPGRSAVLAPGRRAQSGASTPRLGPLQFQPTVVRP